MLLLKRELGALRILLISFANITEHIRPVDADRLLAIMYYVLSLLLFYPEQIVNNTPIDCICDLVYYRKCEKFVI